MSIEKILLEDWSDYDTRKLSYEESFFFDCSKEWEQQYLADKIRKHYPAKTNEAINRSVKQCCTVYSGRVPRYKFIREVLDRLGILCMVAVINIGTSMCFI